MPSNYDIKRGNLTCEGNRSDISQVVSQNMGVGGQNCNPQGGGYHQKDGFIVAGFLDNCRYKAGLNKVIQKTFIVPGRVVSEIRKD